ncbi:MAG: DUF7483 domain-containing protein [bacterium]
MLNKLLQQAAGNAGEAIYVEDVFSTYLYTGNGSTQTITNGVDLAGEGGLVWIKDRATTSNHYLHDTERGSSFNLRTNLTNTQQSTTWFTGFNSNGFGVQSSVLNGSASTYASWTFRKAEKFFDIVTYTGNGVAGRTVAHNLGSVPGCIIVKQTNDVNSWIVYHRSVGATGGLILNGTNAVITTSGYWNNTSPTSTDFTLGGLTPVNQSGGTYVAYLFAHDAGGFGDDGTENVISCGSYTHTNGTATEVDVGFEPQWILWRPSNIVSNWYMYDTMRGLTVDGNNPRLSANQSSAEGSSTFNILQNGFKISAGNDTQTGIYIAIRRGPMKTPESGTEVFDAEITSTDAVTMTTGFPVDFYVTKRTTALDPWYTTPRLTVRTSQFNNNGPENDYSSYFNFDSNTTVGSDAFFGTNTRLNYAFRRAPGFMDVVCYTGNGQTTQTLNHNLGVEPELIIIKSRSSVQHWAVYSKPVGNSNTLLLSGTFAALAGDEWGYTTPTSGVFTIGQATKVNQTNQSFIAYLFATLAGVSKVGSYTGTGTTLQIDCGFSGGARFVLIKRTNSTGDWYVWDSARGIVAGNDPYLLINSTAAEVTSTDYIDPYSAGFEISSTAPAAINANGGTFIYLAIA